MRDLEIKTYDYTVKAIGFVKSIEKEFPEMPLSEFRKSSGDVSIKYMGAISSKENEDFANSLRSCYSQLKQSAQILKSMETIPNERLENEKHTLIKDAELLDEELNTIIKKLIY